MIRSFKKIHLSIIGLVLVLEIFAQPMGKVIEQEVVKSTILGKDVRYSIYLPADYSSSQRTYPVVYLLHGFTDDNTGWLQFGEINRYADKAIYDGIIPPMIIVMPNGDSSFYINSHSGKANYEDFFIKEFIPAIEENYRVKAEKRYRGVAGLSMGGYGTLVYALKHLDMFAACAPLSAAVWEDSELETMSDNTWENVLGKSLGAGLKGKNRLSKTWYDNSILKIVATKTADELKKTRYYIDCGDDDFLIKGNCLLHIALKDKGVPHEFRVRDGEHNWTYWRTGITDALRFIGISFHQQ